MSPAQLKQLRNALSECISVLDATADDDCGCDVDRLCIHCRREAARVIACSAWDDCFEPKPEPDCDVCERPSGVMHRDDCPRDGGR